LEAKAKKDKRDSYKALKRLLLLCFFVFSLTSAFSTKVFAVEIDPIPPVVLDEVAEVLEGVLADGVTGSATLNILFLTVFIILLPSLLVVMTSFLRLIIIFSFLRSGMGTNQMPPNTVLIGLALILTMFFMNDTLTDINENALSPLSAGEITTSEAIDNTMEALRGFMIRQDGGRGSNNLGNNVQFFAQLANFDGLEITEQGFIVPDSIPNYILIPAFVLHELTLAFAFGVFLFIPFIIIDMVVASVLMAMGMMMLPPAMISLPFKVMLFVLVNGWELIIASAAATFG